MPIDSLYLTADLMLLIVTTAVLGLLIALGLLFALRSKTKVSGNPTVLLVGPSGSGKTSLFNLWTGVQAETVTSVSPNRSASVKLPIASQDDEDHELVTLVDLPGHDKLETLTWTELDQTPNVRAVAFVIDAASGQQKITAAAARLFKLLIKTEARGIRVLIMANKSDLFNTLSTARVKAVLEAEMEAIRASKQQSVGEAGTEEFEERAWIGLDGKFRFEDLESEVQIVDGSVKLKKTQKWDQWLSS